jgi:hypothetical protein
MKLQTEGTFNARITGQVWEETRTGQPLCKIQFTTDAGDIQGAFYFDQDPPKFGTETALEKNSRNFAGAIPGWTAENMDREQTYVGAQVTITTKHNLKGYLNVNGIFPLGGGSARKLDTASSAMDRMKAAAKAASAGVTPPAETAPTDDPMNEGPLPF